MKPKMYSAKSNSLLHDHIIDGFHTTHEGLHKLKEDKLITQEEYTSLLEQNVKRLVQRIHEFRVMEGLAEMSKRLTCIFFAIVFGWMQVNGDDLEVRRSSRTRTRTTNSRPARGRSGKGGGRRNELESPTCVSET